jgi:hypothetical protein
MNMPTASRVFRRVFHVSTFLYQYPLVKSREKPKAPEPEALRGFWNRDRTLAVLKFIK